MDKIIHILKEKNYVINERIIRTLDKDLSISEFLLILYFLNNQDSPFNVDKISLEFGLSTKDTLEAFNHLVVKNIISVSSSKDSNGLINEYISLDNLLQKVSYGFQKEEKE